MVKNLPGGDTGDVGSVLGSGRFLGGGNDSSIRAWRIHRERSLLGYSPRGHKKLDVPEHSCVNALMEKCSCRLTALGLNKSSQEWRGWKLSSIVPGPD